MICLSITLCLLYTTFAYSAPCNYVIAGHVIDGDTFESDRGKRVRLLGIDTPETSDPRRDVQWFGKEAANKLKALIDNKKVCLKMDRDKSINKDKYGRYLRYVWLGQKFINAEMIEKGYAFVYIYQPFQYMDKFRRLEREAGKNRWGLWNSNARKKWIRQKHKEEQISLTCGRDGTVCPERSKKYIGKSITVRFFVRKSKDIGNMIFLNSENNYKGNKNFTTVIFRKDALQFPENPSEIFLNKTVDVSGTVLLHKGRPRIIVTSPDQIKITDRQNKG